MSINNITRNYGGYLNNLPMTNSETKDTYALKNKEARTLELKDSIDISTSARNFPRINSIGGITIDKGTAAHTTLYVDRGSYEKILSYSTNNPECQWEEMGIDDEKRWVVVNGQRFECPLSEEEKELRRRLKKGIVEILFEADKEREKRKSKCKPKSENLGSVKLSFDKNNKINLNGNASLQSSDKIKNLMKNDKVMKMLRDIDGINGGQGIRLSL